MRKSESRYLRRVGEARRRPPITSRASARNNRLMAEFAIVFDDDAQRWLSEHPTRDALVIAYSDARC